MKIVVSAVIAGVISTFAVAALADKESDKEAIEACLSNWGKTPFGKDPQYRTVTGKVKILGIGGNINDEKETSKPDLVLVKPNVAVMSKSKLQLLNPNGWYCLKGTVAVLGKTVIELHCKANLASSKDGTTVLGASDNDKGVNVLGSMRLERIGCASNK